MIDLKIISVFLLSFFLTLISIIFLRSLAKKLKIVDVPSKRKTHKGNIPLIGGFAIFISVYISISTESIDNDILIIFMISAFLILLLGFVDDCYPLSANVRILIQILIISLMIFISDLKFSTFGHSFGLQNQIQLGLLSYPITILGMLFVTNAFNLMDGSDGITAGLALLALIGINLVQILSGGNSFNLLSIALFGSLLPYLWFNLAKSSKTKIFLGDSGSLFLGYTISFLLLYESQYSKNISPTFALWLISIPVFDVIYVIFYRIMSSKSLFSPDRSHLHYFLERLGLSNLKIFFIIITLGLFLLLLGIFIEYKIQFVSFITFLFLLSLYLWFRGFSRFSKI